MKTIAIPEDLHRTLTDLKLKSKEKNTADLLKKLVWAYQEKQFLENSMKFRQILNENGQSFEDFLKESEKIREELADERWPD